MNNKKIAVGVLICYFIFSFDFCFAEEPPYISSKEDMTSPKDSRALSGITGYPIADGSAVSMSASIDTAEKGEILMYREVMTDEKTSGGDRVITGYFYVPIASGISWASISNPELLFKVWIDRSGRVDINYVHVSVPRITTYSWDNKNSHGGIDIQGDLSIGYGRRYFRHCYNADGSYGSSYE